MIRNKRTGGPKGDQRIADVVRRTLTRQIEKKVYSTSTIGASVATAGTTIGITQGIQVGDDIATRTGTLIRICRLRILYRGTAVTTSSSIRFILFRDMLNQGTLPGVIDLLPATNWISQYADAREMQQHRFHIINDHTMDLQVAGSNVKTKQYDIALDGKVFYNGTAVSTASNGRGALFLLVIGNAISTQYDYTIQVVYTDA